MPGTVENITAPLVSIITISLNSEKTIRRTIEGVLAQTYPHIEHIIVDGGSTDGTLAVIEEYREKMALVISEKDNGISDAMNKGLKKSSGQIVQFLHSDNYMPPQTVAEAVEKLKQHDEYAFVFGDILKEKSDGRHKTFFKGDPEYTKKIAYTMPRINHPSIFARRDLFEDFGLFQDRWKVAMDYDWLLKVHRGGKQGLYTESILITTTFGGISERQMMDAFRECREISIELGTDKFTAWGYYLARCVKHIIYTGLGKR
jgi:glycosyltransferase involved in cell wall biosynthesis